MRTRTERKIATVENGVAVVKKNLETSLERIEVKSKNGSAITIWLHKSGTISIDAHLKGEMDNVTIFGEKLDDLSLERVPFVNEINNEWYSVISIEKQIKVD